MDRRGRRAGARGVKTLHLFAGVGGGMLADLILGHEPVCAVELNPYCCEVLRERAAEGWFPGLHVLEGDVRMFDPSEWAGRVDCIAAGPPCQDVSPAGVRAGVNGPRTGLWREVVRIAREIRPRFVFLENSPGIIRERGELAAALVAEGYAWKDGRLSALDCGAPHTRDRWFMLADSNRQHGETGMGPWPPESWTDRPLPLLGAWGDDQERTEGYFRARLDPASGVDRMASGIPRRVDRIKALGNSQVPLQAALAWVLLGGPVAAGGTIQGTEDR